MKAIRPLSLRDVVIDGAFWGRYITLIREKAIGYQWENLNDRVQDAARSHCIKNFEIAAGLADGAFYGMVFQDSDLYKWLETVAYSLETHPDPALEKLADGAIALIGSAQQPDGYVNTYYTIKEPGKRWSNLQQGHELYCAGHMIEAAVAYFSATGKRNFLDIAVRFADCIDRTFGLDDGKCHGYPGHQEIEPALVRLYEATGERRYLDLAAYFIRQRGMSPNYFDEEEQKPEYSAIFPQLTYLDRRYSQSHMPPAEQRDTVGHSVRALYMYSAMADLASELGDKALLDACDILYEDVTRRQMYITGAVGATAEGESFTGPYDLPNGLVYGETCASVALMMFCRRMNALNGSAACADVMERALYNTVLAGISLSGTEFFYVNPLEADPYTIAANPGYRHVKPVRQKWFDCSCCYTNITRTVLGLGRYAYAASDDGLYVNLYCSGSARDGARRVEVTTDYPYGGEVTLKVSGGRFKLYLRKPGKGYEILERDWQGDIVKIKLDMSPRLVYCDTRVQSNIGKAAVMRGPLVYCAEQADNGGNLGGYALPAGTAFKECPPPEGLPSESVALETKAFRYTSNQTGLYSETAPLLEPAALKLIPYHLWANRGENEMRVYLNIVTSLSEGR
ncbi:MAG: glycoside hydrolase family 127 protein [Oscillospiraceae bacterium]|nr:glycoside hydrolase family 127 protein [Oscillospiraceae bacterium]